MNPLGRVTRRRACAVALTGAVLAATAAFASAPAAGAATRYVVHKTRYRHADAAADARVHRTASAVETATVGGYSATATGHGRATQLVTARARARGVGHATGAATRRADAQRKAIRRAIARAHRDARVKARARAARTAHARAASRALARARSRARADAQRAATDRAAAMAAAAPPSQGSSPPGELTGGNPPVTVAVGDTGSDPSSAGGLGVSVGIGPCGGEQPTKADGTAWTCSFDDEFDGSSLDQAKWTTQLTSSSGFNQNGACYVDTPDTVSVAGGLLDLSAVKSATPFSCASPRGDFTTDYAAGEVTTLNTFSQTYGRFAVRAKLPAATVAGLQETFWLWPLDQSVYGTWPRAGEIDFAEFYSQHADWLIPYLHYTYDKATVDWDTNVNVVTALPAPYAQPGMSCHIDPSAFNTYTLTWAPGRMTIAVNGQNCLVDNYRPLDLTSPAPFDRPFFLALTQAVGIGSNAPTAATPFPATTQVDYVRAWK